MLASGRRGGSSADNRCPARARLLTALRLGGLAGGLAMGLGTLPAAAEMSFRLVAIGERCGERCPQIIQMEGAITQRTADAFVAFAMQAAASRQLRNVVFIHSPGGSVVGSMRLGKALRAVGATVVVARARTQEAGTGWRPPGQEARAEAAVAVTSATCNSACVYAFMGGRSRVVPPESRVGVHRMQAERDVGYDPIQGQFVRERLEGTREQVASLMAYARQMGVAPNLIALAESVPHETIRVLSREDIRRFGLARERL